MLPEYPNFKSLEFEDLSIIHKHLVHHPAKICEFSLTNLFIWKDFDHPKLTMINKNLCILVTPPNEPSYFLEPIGNHKILDTIKVCLEDAGKMSRLSEEFMFKLNLEEYHVSCLRDQFDYVYETKAFAELKGRKFDGKRNHIKNFKARHPDCEYRELTSEDKDKALKLFETWFKIRKESRHFPKLAYTSQKHAVEKAFQYFDELKLLGGAIFIDKEIIGFTIASPLNKDTLSIHFHYGDPGLRGISQTLWWEAANKTYAKHKYLNLEQDLGIPGLRKSKLSYYPLRLEKKFEIKSIQK